MKLAGIFSGMGSQWPQMALSLQPHWPTFQQELEILDQQVSVQLGWSVLQLLNTTDSDTLLQQPAIANPCIFIVQLALFRQLQALGLKFDMVLGHSTGEFAAACAAGVLDVTQALALMQSHNQLIERVDPQSGYGMAQLSISAADMAQARSNAPDLWQGVVVAAYNSPGIQIVSGPLAQLQELVGLQQAQQKFARLLHGAVPFHSPYLPEGDIAAPVITAAPSKLDLYSSLRGRKINADELNSDYWQQHIRQPVQFYPAVEAMLADGADILLEIAPHHVLLFCLHDIIKTTGSKSRAQPTLKRGENCHLSLQKALAELAVFLPHWQAPTDLMKLVSAPTKLNQNRLSQASILSLIDQQLQKMLPQQADTKLDPERGFFQLGLTSVQVIGFCQRLAAELFCDVDLSWCFDYPTPLQLAAYLAGQRQEHNAVAPSLAETDDIAIIGIGCRFPGGANDPQLFWQRLVQGNSAIREVPTERWQADAYYASDDQPGKSRSKWAGFLQDWDPQQFDAALFDISPAEARALDPQQRLLLEVSLEALQHAGLVPGKNLARDTGVFVGISTDDYKASQLYSGDLSRIGTYTGSGCMYSAAAGRLSYWLGVQGPNKAVDTACSSSLVALHDACQAIRHGECSTALVAGVNLLLTPHLFVCFSALGALSPDGICRAFADGANGYVRGEGCGVLVLKSRKQAEADGDHILALIASTAVNQDGISSNLTAPNGAAQQQVIHTALQRAGISAGQVSYVETHGTGTPLGDPIEAKALGTVYGQAADRSEPLLIGSGKTVFGHLEAAAGILSVIKTTLCLQQQQLVASANFDQPSPLIDFAGLQLQVVTGTIRRQLSYAAVSSFGFSGTNAHVILKAAPASQTQPQSAPERQLLTLSAREPQALTELAARWLHLLRQPDLPLADLCRASYLQRGHQRHRLALTGVDAAALQQQLQQQLQQHLTNSGWRSAQAPGLYFGALTKAQAADYWQALLQHCGMAEAGNHDLLPVLWPQAADFCTHWRSRLQSSALIWQNDSARMLAATDLLRMQVALLLLSEAGIDSSEVLTTATPVVQQLLSAAADDLTRLPLLLAEDEAFSPLWLQFCAGQILTPAHDVKILAPDEQLNWPDRNWLVLQIAAHYQSGTAVYWPALQHWWGRPAAGTAALLPLYPYLKKHFWLDPLPNKADNRVSTQAPKPALMNTRQQLAAVPELCWYSLQFERSQQFLAEHLIFNTPISPAAAHISMLLTALPQLAGARKLSIRQLELHQPLVLAGDSRQRSVQLTLQGPLISGHGAQAAVELRSCDDASHAAADWLLHARAEIQLQPDSLYLQQQQRLQRYWQAPPAGEAESAAPWYQHLAALGYQLGDGYRRIQQIWRTAPQQAWCRVDSLPDQDAAGAVVAPGLMDSLLQTLICSVPDLLSQMQQGGWIYIPFSMGEISQFAPLDQPYYWCYSESQAQGSLLTGRVLVFGADGELKLLADDFSVKQTDQQVLLGKFQPAPAPLYWRTEWRPEVVLSTAASAVATVATGAPPLSANVCYAIAPEGVLPAGWDTLLTPFRQATGHEQHVDKQVLILPALPFDTELATSLERQSEWLRQQIPALLETCRQLQLVLVQPELTGAVAVPAAGAHIDAQPADTPQSCAMSALQQVLRLEYPDQVADLLILPADCPAHTLQPALSQIDKAPQGQIRRWQQRASGGQWLIPQLQPAALPAVLTPVTTAASDNTPALSGTVLLTGGQSALAAVVLPQLLLQGASAVVICSRRPQPADFAEWLSALLPDPAAQGKVHWSRTDVCDEQALQACLAWIAEHLPPLQAVWHCAGQLADVSLARMSKPQLSEVLAPKVRGSLNLHLATIGLPLRQFVLFSSVASVFGNFGQANYALGNGFMDGLVLMRQQLGLSGLSLSFGPWQQGGMALAQAEKIAAQGYQWLTPQLLEPHWSVLCAASGHLVIAQADWSKLAANLHQPDLLQPLVNNAKTAVSGVATSLADSAVDFDSWRQLSRPQAELALQDWLVLQVEAITGFVVSVDQSLMAQGVDSLGTVTIRSTLNQQLALSLPVSLIFNFPSIELLAAELCRQLFGPAPTVISTAPAVELPHNNPFNYLENLSEAELNALILQEFSAV
ncbi:SDR family NAD(P)-dependent oxidoreductase [Rheinheimera riviphila]|uniref:SDR family NAD(P)-dependent oxidoreductase n=1 Tax=Rheinheimera riviphila TaxID=1834037 RepID=A0A437R1Y1_9GAMM|nr:type I polyketide synthase [Rheinheimera riviphila]RVU40809.1 SDR family NAD(P)-dependent oxidoreductase [Rheinheimera riviphila]